MTDQTIRRTTSRNTISTHPDFWAVAMFSTIGILVMLNLMLRFPDLSTVIAQYNQF
jgi:hypothetical protein